MLALDPLLNDLTLGDVVIVLLKVVVIFVIGLVATMLMVWFERKAIAGMQNRIGPNKAGPFGILQTLADGIKLFFKEDLIPEKSDRFVFKLAPYLVVRAGLPGVERHPARWRFQRRQDGRGRVVQPRHPAATRRSADRRPVAAGPQLDLGVRHHARRLGQRFEVPAARARCGPRLRWSATRQRSGSASQR